MACVTLEVVNSDKKCHAVIANFLNGKLNHKHARHMRVGYYENTKRRNKRDNILVAETARMQYVGYNTGPSAPRACTSSKYLIGKLDRTTGKMRVYDAEMFNLKPVLAVEEDAETNEGRAPMTYMEQVDRLTSAFGTSRRKRAMSSRLKNKITGDVLKTAVGSALNEVLAREPELGPAQAKTPESSGIIPPHHMDATRSQDVYLLKDIISAEEMEALKTPVKPWLNTANIDISVEGYPECVATHLHMLPIEMTSRCRKACCLMYLTYMIALFHMKFKEISRKDPFPEELEVPDIVKKNLLSAFTLTSCTAQGKTLRSRPARMKDKLLSYALVLCLILEDFNLEFTRLRKDFCLSQIRLNNHLRALGCQVTNQRVVDEEGNEDRRGTATLPVPLTFPELSKKRTKERR